MEFFSDLARLGHRTLLVLSFFSMDFTRSSADAADVAARVAHKHIQKALQVYSRLLAPVAMSTCRANAISLQGTCDAHCRACMLHTACMCANKHKSCGACHLEQYVAESNHHQELHISEKRNRSPWKKCSCAVAVAQMHRSVAALSLKCTAYPALDQRLSK